MKLYECDYSSCTNWDQDVIPLLLRCLPMLSMWSLPSKRALNLDVMQSFICKELTNESGCVFVQYLSFTDKQQKNSNFWVCKRFKAVKILASSRECSSDGEPFDADYTVSPKNRAYAQHVLTRSSINSYMNYCDSGDLGFSRTLESTYAASWSPCLRRVQRLPHPGVENVYERVLSTLVYFQWCLPLLR